MLVIAVAWMFVVVLVAVVEATAPNGSALGAIGTLVFWGALPLALVLYLAAAAARRRRRRDAVRAAALQASAMDPDGRRHAPGNAVAPEREEP